MASARNAKLTKNRLKFLPTKLFCESQHPYCALQKSYNSFPRQSEEQNFAQFSLTGEHALRKELEAED
jgi:hypothetical protein